MAPIEAFISSPSIQKELIVKDGQNKHFHQCDLNVDLEGKNFGGDIYIRHDSQKKPREIHINRGEIIQKTSKVIIKGGIVEEIEMKFIGK